MKESTYPQVQLQEESSNLLSYPPAKSVTSCFSLALSQELLPSFFHLYNSRGFPDPSPSFAPQIQTTSKSCYLHLQNVCRLQLYLNPLILPKVPTILLLPPQGFYPKCCFLLECSPRYTPDSFRSLQNLTLSERTFLVSLIK